jgi:hypothetical protein
MNANSESDDKGKTPSTDEKTEAAKNTGGKSSGAGLTNTLGDTTEQRVGDAGSIAPTSPASTSENKKTTKAAFSAGTKPANKGQRETPAETETTDFGQTDTTRS